jgi:hypothetical protein
MACLMLGKKNNLLALIYLIMKNVFMSSQASLVYRSIWTKIFNINELIPFGT